MTTDIYTYFDTDIERWMQAVPVDGYRTESEENIARKREYAQRQDAINKDPRHYVASYHEPVRKLSALLALNELGAVMKLLPYMRLDKSGKLYYEGKRMGSAEISKAIGKATRWTATLISTLTSCGVLTESREGRRKVYEIGAEYHSIGKSLSGGRYTKVYQTKTRSDVKNLSVQAAGLLYCMIPYIHYERLYLCHNPDGDDFDALNHMVQSDLARILGEERSTISRSMRELSLNGFIMRSESYGVIVIKMNPDVMFRKSYTEDEYTESVRYEFTQNKRLAESAFDGSDEELPY
ncbi:hypothetical protein J2T13_000162 [Paenibacillus sp. DS2015]|uniref:hypothetical protein n=1 Tax=Paenibacillus sp. DS2015 TaxID=3373917 RepID=UPI003D1A9BE5